MKIAEGAEATITRDANIIWKTRNPKRYRIKEIDERLRKFRTKREAKIYEELSKKGIPTPKLIAKSDYELQIEFLEGEKLREVLNSKNCESYCGKLGGIIGTIHSANIVHFDLTTSNMIVKDGKIYLIDFGLSAFSSKAEDKAVDLHVFEEALLSKHNDIWQQSFAAFISAYKDTNSSYKEVLSRLKKVEERGRYKTKGMI